MNSKIKYLTVVILILGIWFWFSLPKPIFQDPVSFVLEARDGSLLGAKIANDGQWRFPYNDTVPEKFKQAIVAFEDRRFYSHIGIDFLAILRALKLNIEKGEIVSGASTLSMQVMRLSRKGKKRTVVQKAIEAVWSVRMELSYSKEEILALYASNAPYGGNVVGLDAASWRYFGKESKFLSWSEAATLAVLPNAPSLIHPGKNRSTLLHKRNNLLKNLLDLGQIDTTTYLLSLDEALPEKPHPLPSISPHFLNRAQSETINGNEVSTFTRYKSTLDYHLQKQVLNISEKHHLDLKNKGINNICALVIDIEKNEVLAYLGNVPDVGIDHSEHVDIVKSERSTGSILKPFLYALSLKSGQILPKSLIPDIPTYFPNYRPENFTNSYDGAVPANEALSRSLNIPFVRILQEYGVDKFHYEMRKLGITTFRSSPSHYGLSIILGGAEATLWDLTNLYASLGRRLKSFHKNQGQYDESDFCKASSNLLTKTPSSQLTSNTKFLTADVIWSTFEALTTLERPDTEGKWQHFESTQKIAWKTGTSFGFRDAWSIGVTPKYAVGIWVGNADGEGRPGLTGISTAAPIMFDIFSNLPKTQWFDQIFDEMPEMEVCKISGFLAANSCSVEKQLIPESAKLSSPCSYHKLITVDENEQYRVVAECMENQNFKIIPWFSLPPTEEFYYRTKHPEYLSLPPVKENCKQYYSNSRNSIDILYPLPNSEILIPIGLNGEYEKVVFKAVQSISSRPLFWHINTEFVGETVDIHNMAYKPEVGWNKLTISDIDGNSTEVNFKVVSNSK